MRDMCDLSDTRVSDTSDTAATSVGAIERALRSFEAVLQAEHTKKHVWPIQGFTASISAARDELAMLRARPEGKWTFGWHQVPADLGATAGKSSSSSGEPATLSGRDDA